MTQPPPLFETKAGLKDVDDDTIRTGAMIALRPRQDHVDRLAVEGGEEPQELHCTMLFMGKGDDYTYDTRARIIDAMRRVALDHRQVTGKGWNIGIFNPDGEQPCVALGVGGTEMVTIRNAIVEALQGMDLLQVPEQHEPWVPHVTLNYTDDPKKALDYIDLVGDVTFDAIRVVFSGIVDDIPLQTISADNEGWAGGNRYAFAPPNLMKSFSFDVDHPVLDVLTKGKCLYCDAKATKKTGVDGGAFIMSCEKHKDRAKRDADGDGMETKVRHVRTAAGVRRFGQPIGSVIVGDGSVLKNIKEVESDYDGYNKYNVRGQDVYTAKEGGKYVAYDANDNVINSDAKEDALLRALDRSMPKEGSSPAKLDTNSSAARKKADTMAVSGHPNLSRAESEYDGYSKFVGKNGQEFYHEHRTGNFYDADDNLIFEENDRIEAFKKLNALGGMDTSERTVGKEMTYGNFKKASSEYDGYDKYTTPGGMAVYRDRSTNAFYDKDDNELSDVKLRSLNETSAPKASTPAPSSREDRELRGSTTGNMGGARSNRGKARAAADELRKARERSASNAGASKPAAPASTNRDDGRPTLVGNINASDEVDAVLDKVKGSTTPADVIAEIRRLAQRQADVRNKRKLMLYAESLKEAKVFAGLVQMDPWLRAVVLETKLITPGGRVGTDRSLGSRSNGQNWVERTPMGRLPKYIRIVANGIKGRSKSQRIALAVGAMKRWASGGDNVKPAVRAAAAKALAEWEALKAAA